MARIRTRIELDRSWVLAVAASMAAPRVNETTTAVLNRSKILTPVDTGNLRASQRKTMRVRKTYVAGTVETRVKYALYVHNGTVAHLIRARNARFLRFEVDGKVVFRRSVWHPGTKPRPFLATALIEEAEKRGFRVIAGTGTGFVASD